MTNSDASDVHLDRLTKLVFAAAVLAVTCPVILIGYAAISDHTPDEKSFYVGVGVGAMSMFGLGMAVIILIGITNALRRRRARQGADV